MYILLVTQAAMEQQSGPFKMDRERLLEYTEDSIRSQIGSMSLEALECLQSWPCLLMAEGRGDGPARVGKISRAKVSTGNITLDFEPIPQTLSITNNDVWKLRAYLDIGDFEFNRNHISVKDRNLFSTLSNNGFTINQDEGKLPPERPLPAPPRATLIQAGNAISEWTHAEIDALLLEIGLPELSTDYGSEEPRERATKIVGFALEKPGATTADNALLSVHLIKRALGSSNERPTAVPTSTTDNVSESRDASAHDNQDSADARSPNRVFVVHGQNDAARKGVVSFLQAAGLEPIVLHEQPNMGRHLLTKFIQEAKLVTFAVILMTDDDEGCIKNADPRPRARQNVILELGYFLAHLGLPRVCALITPGLETPSDFDGIVYIPMNSDGSWQKLLARELKAAKMPVDERRADSFEHPPRHQNKPTNTKSKSDDPSERTLHPSESAAFFAERFGLAFPGVRNVNWYENSEAVSRLKILLQSPLVFDYRDGNTTPIWWWRDGNMQINEFRYLKKNIVLLDGKELDISRIAAVPFSSYYRSFVYVEALPMKPTGLYPWNDDKIKEWIEDFGYAYEEYGLYLGKHFVRRTEYDDNAAFINGKHVVLGSDVELRVRYITPYNFVIASHLSPINNPEFDKELESVLNRMLCGKANIEELKQKTRHLPKPKAWNLYD